MSLRTESGLLLRGNSEPKEANLHRIFGKEETRQPKRIGTFNKIDSIYLTVSFLSSNQQQYQKLQYCRDFFQFRCIRSEYCFCIPHRK